MHPLIFNCKKFDNCNKADLWPVPAYATWARHESKSGEASTILPFYKIVTFINCKKCNSATAHILHNRPLNSYVNHLLLVWVGVAAFYIPIT